VLHVNKVVVCAEMYVYNYIPTHKNATCQELYCHVSHARMAHK